MKKVFLSLITIFMVLSLSVVLIKAEGETTVELRDEISVRTDANVGIMWEGTVNNPQEGQTYGFLFAQGEVNDLSVETADVVNVEITELLEENKFRATMVKFPKAAVAQDISVRTYVKTGDEYAYSEYVDVRNLAETVLYAKNQGLTGDGLTNVVTYLENNYMKTYNVGNTQYLVKPIYEYEPTELAKEFIKDWNSVMGQSIDTMSGWAANNKNGASATVTKDVILNTNIYKFFNNDEKAMLAKWEWLLDYIPTTANNSFAKTQAQYIKGEKALADSGNADWYGSQHLISRIENFFTRKSATTGLSYQSSYFTTNNEYPNLISTIDGLTNKIYATVECDYVKVGSSIQLSEQPELSNGYAWDGFTANETIYAAESEYVVTNSAAVFVPTTHAIEYTITYKDGENIINTLEPVTYKVTTATFNLPEYSKDLHEFNGWYDNPQFDGDPVTKIENGSYGNLVLYAKTTEKSYLDVTVTFNMNGGGAFRYETTEEAIADFLKDYNTARGTSHTKETFYNLSSGTEIGAASLFLYNATYKAKWMWLVNYITTVASDANKPAYTVFYNYNSQSELNNANTNYIYEIAYELRGWVGQTQYTKNTNYKTADYSNDDIKSSALSAAQGATQVVYCDPVELPIPKRSGYEFQGWYTNEECTGDKVTQYPGYKKDMTKITYYAKWELKVTEVTLTDVDLATIESINPTKYVNATFNGGKYVINEQEYVYGETVFASVADALAAANGNDVIYLFAGTYNESVTIEKDNISVYGPNYNVKGTDVRNNEAILSSFVLNSSNIHVEGIKTTATYGIQIKGGSSITVMNSICTGSQTADTQAVVSILGNISNLTIKNCLIESLNNTKNYYRGIYASSDYVVTNATIENNTIKNDAPNSLYTDAVRFNKVKGEINIKNNFIDWGGNNYTLFFGSESIAANTTINILNNTFDMTNKGSGMSIRNINSTTVVNIKNNSFDNVGGTMIHVRGSDLHDTTTVAEINICNNALLNLSTSISIQLSSKKVVMDNNYFFQDVTFGSVSATITNPAPDAETALSGE